MDMCPGKLQELIEENQWLQQELSEESAIRLAEEQALTNLVASIYQVENELSLEGRSSDPCPPFLEGRMSRLGIVEEVDEEDLDLLSDDEVPVDESFQIKCLLDEMISQIEKEVDSEEQSPALESHHLLPSNITDEIAKLTQELQLQSSELLLAKKRIEELTYLVNLKKSAVLQDDLEAWKELVRHQKTLLVKMTSELEATQQQLVQAKRLVETTDRGVQVDLDVDMDLVPLQVREV